MTQRTRRTQRGRTKRPSGLTRQEVAKLLGCNVRTVAKFQDEGMPVALRGRGGRGSRFDGPACVAWKKQRDEAPQSTTAAPFMVARTRKEMAQALEAEQRIAKRAGDLVDAKEVEARIADDYARCRTKLLGLPRKVKALLPHLSATDVTVIDDTVRQALEELAGP